MWLSFSGNNQEQNMAHTGIDSGTTNIFDEVDKSDFKTDFGSEFPVGSTFEFLLLTLPTHPYPSLSPSFCSLPYVLEWLVYSWCKCDLTIFYPGAQQIS